MFDKGNTFMTFIQTLQQGTRFTELIYYHFSNQKQYQKRNFLSADQNGISVMLLFNNNQHG